MSEMRGSQRVSFVVNGQLHYQQLQLACHLENISVSGALISLLDSPPEPIRKDDRCFLALFQETAGNTVHLTAKIVHYGFNLVGLKFTDLDDDSENLLESLIRKADYEKAAIVMASSRLYDRIGINSDMLEK